MATDQCGGTSNSTNSCNSTSVAPCAAPCSCAPSCNPALLYAARAPHPFVTHSPTHRGSAAAETLAAGARRDPGGRQPHGTRAPASNAAGDAAGRSDTVGRPSVSTWALKATGTVIAAHVFVRVLCVLRQPAAFLYSSCTLHSDCDRLCIMHCSPSNSQPWAQTRMRRLGEARELKLTGLLVGCLAALTDTGQARGVFGAAASNSGRA